MFLIKTAASGDDDDEAGWAYPPPPVQQLLTWLRADCLVVYNFVGGPHISEVSWGDWCGGGGGGEKDDEL